MIEINVLPEVFRPIPRAPFALIFVGTFGLVLVAMLAAYAFEQRAALARAMQRNRDLVLEREVALNEKAKLELLRAAVAKAERRQNTIVEIAQSKIVWSQKLAQFGRIMGDYPAFWIDRLALASGASGRGTLTLGFHAEDVDLSEIARFRERLESDSTFAYHFERLSAPRIESSRRGSASVLAFDVTLPVK